MQIVEVEAFSLKLPHTESYLGVLPDGSSVPDGYTVRPPWRSLYSPRFETVIVKITAADGTAGWGEALTPVGPGVVAEIIKSLLAPQLVGHGALTPRPTWHRLSDLMRERGHLVGHQADALAAVDIALWDLAAKLQNLSLSQLLGGSYRDSVPTYISGLPRPTDSERAMLAKDWSDRDARAVKLHLGNGVEADLATVDAVQCAAPELRVSVDAHWAYTLHEARKLAAGLADRNAWFLEAPLAPEDEDGHVELVKGSPVPIAIGETLRNRYEFDRWVTRRALDIAQPDIGRTGITEALAIAELCSAKHVPIAPHHSVGLGIVLAAGIHVSAAISNLLVFEYQPTSTDVGQSILHSPIQLTSSQFELPRSPGLGIDVDEDHIRTLAKESQ